MNTARNSLTLVFLGFALMSFPTLSAAQAPTPDLTPGKRLYESRCATCHGRDGNGRGPAARGMDPPPRDLTGGVYKLRSTSSGDLPTDTDIFRTLTRGMRGTSMPAWSGLSRAERWQLVYYVKSLSTRFDQEEPGTPLEIPAVVPVTPARIQRGRQVYVTMQCGTCHGDSGRADGPSSQTLKDDNDRPIYPFDMTRGRLLKGGTSPEDIYRTFQTGLDGTPMPAYEGLLTEEDSWALVHYVRSLFEDNDSL